MSTFADKLAAGLADALTLRDPDLSWQPVPLDSAEGDGDAGTAESRRLHPALDDGDPAKAAPLPDPDHADKLYVDQAGVAEPQTVIEIGVVQTAGVQLAEVA